MKITSDIVETNYQLVEPDLSFARAKGFFAEKNFDHLVWLADGQCSGYNPNVQSGNHLFPRSLSLGRAPE